MADQDLWRKNIPADFDGRQSETWDGEIDASIVNKIIIVTGIFVVSAFGICWLLILGLNTTLDEPYLSPVAEANVRTLPPTPLLQAHPEADWDILLAEMNERLGFDPAIDSSFAYGWVNEADGRVHLPIARAMDLVLESPGALGQRSMASAVLDERQLELEAAIPGDADRVTLGDGAVEATKGNDT